MKARGKLDRQSKSSVDWSSSYRAVGAIICERAWWTQIAASGAVHLKNIHFHIVIGFLSHYAKANVSHIQLDRSHKGNIQNSRYAMILLEDRAMVAWGQTVSAGKTVTSLQLTSQKDPFENVPGGHGLHQSWAEVAAETWLIISHLIVGRSDPYPLTYADIPKNHKNSP